MKAELIEKIEEYLNGGIQREQLEDYANLHEEDGLDEKINWVKDTAIAVEASGLKSQLNTLLDQQKKTAPEKRIIKLSLSKWTMGIAASMLILVTAYFGLKDQNNPTSLYAQYDYQDPGLPVLMSQVDNYALNDALSYFGEENYDVAIQKLSNIEEPKSDTILYYLGASYYYKNDYKKALDVLTENFIDRTSEFNHKADWLRVMSLVKQEDQKKALLLLDKIIANTTHSFREKALALKTSLNNQ